MPIIREINDKQFPYPSIDELRESQRQGSTGKGLPENDNGPLNSGQGMGVDIQE